MGAHTRASTGRTTRGSRLCASRSAGAGSRPSSRTTAACRSSRTRRAASRERRRKAGSPSGTGSTAWSTAAHSGSTSAGAGSTARCGSRRSRLEAGNGQLTPKPPAMARATTRPAHRGAGSRRSARRSRKTPIRSQTPRRNRAPSRSTAEQRADLLGGSLLALGVFLGFVEYLGWNGGVVGLKLDDGLRLIVGRATAVAPILLVAVGGTIFLQTDVWRLRPLRTGAVVGHRNARARALDDRHRRRRAPRRARRVLCAHRPHRPRRVGRRQHRRRSRAPWRPSSSSPGPPSAS